MGPQVAIRETGDVTIVDLRGRSTIDRGESEALGKKLEELAARGARKVLLNLAELTQVDSSGINVIAGTCVSLRRQGGDLKLLRPSGLVREVLEVVKLLEIIASFENEDEAVASFGTPGHFVAKQ